MTLWFVRVELDADANDDQVNSIHENLKTFQGSMVIIADEIRNRTEISFYEPGPNMAVAINSALERVYEAVRSANFHALAVKLDIQSREDRNLGLTY